MRIAVAGATGKIGAFTVAALERDGHEAVRISRSLGVDLLTGAGLDNALRGVDAVVDATNAPNVDRAGFVSYLGQTTGNLLAAEARAGVRHHVLLSIAGIAEITGNDHYDAKREQERLVTDGPVPWTIVPSTQFHDFAETAASWTEHGGTATIAPLLVQPIAPGDVGEVLAELAVGDPHGRYADIAGPDTQDFVDMARRTFAARGREVRLVPTWDGVFGLSMSGNVLLPAKDARITPTSFDDWLRTLG